MYKAEQFAEVKEKEILSVVQSLKKEKYSITFNAAITTNSFYVGFYTNKNIYNKIRISDHEPSLNENFANLDFSEISQIYDIIKENGRKLKLEVYESETLISIFSDFKDFKETIKTITNWTPQEGSVSYDVQFFKKENKYFYKVLKNGFVNEIDSLSFLKSFRQPKIEKKERWI